MNAADASSWSDLAFRFIPSQGWVGLASAIIIGAVLPWLAERIAPKDWNDDHVRVGVYIVAVLFGPLAALSFWHDAAALTLGLVGGLAAQVLREWASRRWLWLSPRQAVKLAADGSRGYHVPGIDETVWTRPDATVPKDKA